MLKFLKSLVGGGKAAGTDDPTLSKAVVKDITTDLGRFKYIDRALAQRVTDYVLTGENGSVLYELSQYGDKVTLAFGVGSYDGTPAEKALFKASLKARESVLNSSVEPGSIWMRRYCEIIAFPQTYGVFHYGGPSPKWLRHFMTWDNNSHVYSPNPPKKSPPNLSIALEWREPDQNATVLAFDLLVLKARSSYYFGNQVDIAELYDFQVGLSADKQAIIEAFFSYDKPGQVLTINILKQFGSINDGYFDFIYQQYLSSPSVKVRDAAQNALLGASSDQIEVAARKTLEEGNPKARGQAAQVLGLVLGEKARPALEAHLENEKAQTVRKAIELALGAAVVASPAGGAASERNIRDDGPQGYLAADGTTVAVPPEVTLPEQSEVPESVRAGYRKLLEKNYEQNLRYYEDQKERYANATAEQRKYWHGSPIAPKPIDPRLVDQYCAALEGDGSLTNNPIRETKHTDVLAPHGGAAIAGNPPFNDPGLTLRHLSRAFIISARKQYATPAQQFLMAWQAVAAAMQARFTEGADLRTVRSLLSEVLSPNAFAVSMLNGGYYSGTFSEDLSHDAIWPYLACHFKVIDQAMGQTTATDIKVPDPIQGLVCLALFPKLPARYFNSVLMLALSHRKKVNEPARALLYAIEGVEQRVLPFLNDGKQEVRAGVATMLGTIGAKSTIEPLRAALKKEKSELVRAAMLNALRRMEFDISEFVSPESLIKEAQTGLKTKKTKDVPWLDLATLPALTWAKGGSVPADVPHWWINLASKMAQPGGNALFSLWLDQLAAESAEALGRHILGTFLRFDATHCTEEEANAHAKAHAQARYDQYMDYAKRWNNDYYRSYTYEKAFAELRRERLNIYPNNAYGERGVLALATRAEGTFAVQAVRTYMRDHYLRTFQVKALTEYLAGNPASAALQMLLSIARRHRTNGVQVLAGELVERISDDRGWSAEELADRTIPTAGLDERGILDLEIGSRLYQARLDSEDALTLYNPDGKVVQSLPQVKEGPDKDSAAEAKKALSTAKKELKQVHEFQIKRLYEALCTGRRWSVSDWRTYLLEHPIVGRLVQRLVWLGLDANNDVAGSFRPMEDLSLTDHNDDAVDLEKFAFVQLAHNAVMGPEETAAWKQHLDDYKVAPLFDQLNRPVLSGKKGAAIDDRNGHIIEAFKLRTAAQKLGYERAQAEDGGWFTQYLKPFPSIGITAAIEFTGSPLPEENRDVALISLGFIRSRKGKRSAYGREIPLSDVPPVLLSEVWNDWHQIAEAGKGFSEDWQKKVAW